MRWRYNLKYICLLLCIHTLQATQPPKLSVLLIHYQTGYIAGVGESLIQCYKMLVEHGQSAFLLSIDHSRFQAELDRQAIPYQAIPSKDYAHTNKLTDHIHNMCQTLGINVIVANWYDHAIQAAKNAARKSSTKVVFIDRMHFSKSSDCKLLKGIDGAIGLSPDIVQSLCLRNKENHLNIKHITYIPPFFDETKFLNFTTTQTRKDFFKKEFGISIKKLPIICMIANMYRDKSKNHSLLLNALHKLIYEKNKQCEVMLVGDGFEMEMLQKMVARLKLTQYVHFLGFTQRIPDILYHSDFHVLSSKKEAFGRVHIEAAFMKRPSIGATETGAQTAIQDGITGLIFKNNDVDDFAAKIEYLLNNPQVRVIMGNNAFNFARQNFSSQQHYLNFEQFLCTIIAS